MSRLQNKTRLELQEMRKTLKGMSVDQLKELQEQAYTEYREVSAAVDKMRPSDEQNDLAAISANIYALSELAKHELKEIDRKKLSDRTNVFFREYERASKHLIDVREGFNKVVLDGTENDIKKAYEELKSAQKEKEYAETKYETYSRMKPDIH